MIEPFKYVDKGSAFKLFLEENVTVFLSFDIRTVSSAVCVALLCTFEGKY